MTTTEKRKNELTDVQREILKFLQNYITQNGHSPSVREICDGVRLKSTSSVQAHLETLVHNKYITKDPTHPRTIKIIDDTYKPKDSNTILIPVVKDLNRLDLNIRDQSNLLGTMPVAMSANLPDASSLVYYQIGEECTAQPNANILPGDYILVSLSDNVSTEGTYVVRDFLSDKTEIITVSTDALDLFARDSIGKILLLIRQI